MTQDKRDEMKKMSDATKRIANAKFKDSKCNLCGESHWKNGLLNVREAVECIEKHFKKKLG